MSDDPQNKTDGPQDAGPVQIKHAYEDYSENEYYGDKPTIYRVLEQFLAAIFYTEDYEHYAKTHGFHVQDPMDDKRNEARTIENKFDLSGTDRVAKPEALERVSRGDDLDYNALPEHVSRHLDATTINGAIRSLEFRNNFDNVGTHAPDAATKPQQAAPTTQQQQPEAQPQTLDQQQAPANTMRAQPKVTPGMN